MLAARQTQNGMCLSELLEGIIKVDRTVQRDILGLSTDSRNIMSGDLFMAYRGDTFDAREFIDEAIAGGAAAILEETEKEKPAVRFGGMKGRRRVPVFSVFHLRNKIGLIAARFYGSPSAAIKVIGVTGTNGKTSCTYYLARALQCADYRCGVIGTLGSGFPDQLSPSGLTNPDPITLQATLAELKAEKAQAVAMEVSSHGLVQNRTSGVEFDIGVFTNLTRDHLDYHSSMEQYGQAKRRLFEQPGMAYAVVNVDDNFGRHMISTLPKNLRIYGYSASGQSIPDIHMITAEKVKFTQHGFRANIQTPWGEGVLSSKLLGRFNLSNLLAVIAVLGIMDVPLEDALHYVAQLRNAPGRMQTLGGGKLPLVVVDYAHTPDALEQALRSLREHCQGKLWCIFGCGGDRDRGKRTAMGRIAEQYSDQIIITDDNPRYEDPEQIVKNIMEGLLCPWAVEVLHDRQTAIAHVIDCAQPEDVVLVAGKGHENYQLVAGKRLIFDDVEQVQAQLKSRINYLKLQSKN